MTRNGASDKAKELEKAGAEIVEADADDGESLKRAFTSAYGAYCVTNFWEQFSPEKELAQAENMARAASDAGLQTPRARPTFLLTSFYWDNLSFEEWLGRNATRIPIG